tara:strand:- start:10576 stop:11457 length:882 start_codon:yes stop_codon:yes gene_type:complete
MKTLIQNYTSALSTEPMYLQQCLAEVGEESVLWSDPSKSAFDTFDFTKPDVFISHFKFLTNDIIKYLSGNKNISMILNVSGAQQSEIETIEGIIKDTKINVPFLFTNMYKNTSNVSQKGVKIEGIYPAADVFIPRMPTPDYRLDTCVFSITNNSMVQESVANQDSCHVVSFNQQDQSGYADMFLDITSAVSFYEKYDTVVLADDVNIVTSQLLFDSLLRCNNIKIKVDESQQSTLDNILSTLFIETSEEGDIGQILKKQVKSRHNCFRRAARLFRLLKSSEISGKLERTSEKL